MQTEFFNRTGKIAIGSRLRMLTSKITEDAKKLYKIYDVALEPKWFPVFYVLAANDAMTVTEIALEIGHSQPSVSKIIREMAKKGLIEENKDSTDGRKNVITLTESGVKISENIKHQYTDVDNAIENILAETQNDLWKAIEEWEYMLEQKSLMHRVMEKRKEREGANVKMVDYDAQYYKAFRDLNEEWISTYFKMETTDYKSLDNPDDYILSKGGHIIVALHNNEAVGVCALIKMNDDDYDYELAKMAVSPKAQGLSIGWLLGQAIIDKAISLGANSLYLESNTVLKPAINLYHKLGFQKIVGRSTPYERCNIQMELILK